METEKEIKDRKAAEKKVADDKAARDYKGVNQDTRDNEGRGRGYDDQGRGRDYDDQGRGRDNKGSGYGNKGQDNQDNEKAARDTPGTQEFLDNYRVTTTEPEKHGYDAGGYGDRKMSSDGDGSAGYGASGSGNPHVDTADDKPHVNWRGQKFSEEAWNEGKNTSKKMSADGDDTQGANTRQKFLSREEWDAERGFLTHQIEEAKQRLWNHRNPSYEEFDEN